MMGLDQSADVYTPAGGDGDYTVSTKTGLACRLAYIQQGPNEIGEEREDTGQRRRLLWQEAYTMPEDAQIEVDSVRWNVLYGTLGVVRGPDSSVVYRRCEVVSVL